MSTSPLNIGLNVLRASTCSDGLIIFFTLLYQRNPLEIALMPSAGIRSPAVGPREARRTGTAACTYPSTVPPCSRGGTVIPVDSLSLDWQGGGFVLPRMNSSEHLLGFVVIRDYPGDKYIILATLY